MLHWRTIVVVCVMLSVLKSSAFRVSTPDFCYKEVNCNPYTWGKRFSDCSPHETKLHSPIDLATGRIIDSTQSLELWGLENLQASWTLANVRDTVVVEFDAGMTVSGSWLKYGYTLVEMRFHWGSNATNGSEHTLNKRRFPMEMQIVGVAPECDDVDKASLQQSCLAMIGVFIDIGAKDNVPFKAISDAVVKVSYPGDSVNVTPPALSELMPRISSKFYHYQGGQTTPPCRQTVEWIVFEKPVLISNNQYMRFATHLHYSDKNNTAEILLVENYRPVQSSSKHKIFGSTAIKIHPVRGAAQSHFVPLLILFFSLLFCSLVVD